MNSCCSSIGLEGSNLMPTASISPLISGLKIEHLSRHGKQVVRWQSACILLPSECFGRLNLHQVDVALRHLTPAVGCVENDDRNAPDMMQGISYMEHNSQDHKKGMLTRHHTACYQHHPDLHHQDSMAWVHDGTRRLALPDTMLWMEA